MTGHGEQHHERALCLHLPKELGRKNRVWLLGVILKSPWGWFPAGKVHGRRRGVCAPHVWGSFDPCPGWSLVCSHGVAAGREHGAAALGWCLGPGGLCRWGVCCQAWLRGCKVSHGVAEPGKDRAGMGPAAESKGRLKKLLEVTSVSSVLQPPHVKLAVPVSTPCPGRSFAPEGKALAQSWWGGPATRAEWHSRRPCWLCRP